MMERGFRFPEFQEQLAQITVRSGRTRVDANGLAQVAERGRLVPLLPQGVGEIVMGRGEVGLKPDRVAQVADRQIKLAHGGQRRAQVAEELGIVGLELESRSAACDGAIRRSQRPVSLREAGMEGCLARLKGHRPADQRRRPA